MTDYTKSTNFATKDSLPSGNPAKIVKGTEINTEFDNIATAVATKSNSASPTFTGTLTAADVSITGNTTLGNDATDTVTITADVASNVIPSADSTYTLGDASNYWSHGYVDAVTTTGDVSVGGNLTVTGNATISGNLTFGDASTDTINLTADIASNILPSADNTYDIGGTGAEWKDIYINGVAYVDSIDLAGTSITATGAELNTLDGITATTAELNTLDGITATVTELNYTDGVTSAIQTQLDNKQPLDADLTAIAALANTDGNIIVGNGTAWVAESGATARASLGLTIGTDVQAYSSVLAGTTASFTTADETKLDGIETGATADQTASEILTAIKTVDGTGSGLDADLLDGNEATAFATAAQGTLADSALQSSDIGSSVQAYDSNLTSFVGTFTLPTTDSTAGYVLKTDGAGTLSFVAQSAYDESTVAITGGTIDGTTIGGTTPAAGDFTTLSATSTSELQDDVSFGASQSLVSGNGFEYIFNHPSSDSTRNTVALLNTSNSTQPGRFRFVKSRGAGSSNVTVADGDNIWNIQGYGDDGTSIRYTGSIDMVVSGTPSTGAVPSKMLFSTATTAGTVTTGIEISNTQDVTISNGNLTVSGQYIEEYAATGTSGAVTIDLDTGNNFSTAMAGAVTYTFSNAATSGTVSSFTLKVVNNGSAITWPTSVDWPAGTAPTLSASGATDVFVFYTHDGGTTWYGFTAGQAMA